MSGILKKVGKVFKKVVKSKIFKYVAIAAAVYFTAGIAAGAMGSTFAVGLPGISSAASALGMGSVGAFGTVALEAAGVAGSTIAGGFVAGDAMLPGALAGGNGLAGSAGAMATAGSSAGITGSITQGLSALNTVKGVLGGGQAETASGGTSSGVSGPTAAPKLQNGAGSGGSSDPLLKYFGGSETVAKAALTFGSDALKTGVGMYAAKTQQDAADANRRKDLEDRTRREAAPILLNPAAATYNKGVVNAAINDEPRP